MFRKTMVLALGFSSEIHLELIFVNTVRGDSAADSFSTVG